MKTVARVKRSRVRIFASLGAALLALAAGPGLDLAAPPAAQPAPRPAEPREFPALEALEREVGRLVESARPGVVGVVARSPIEYLLDSLGDWVRVEDVQVEPPGPLARRIGSGIVFDTAGHIVTLASVVSGATEVVVLSSDGRRHPATVAGIDDYSGLALLKATDAPGTLKPLPFADSEAVKVGTLVTTFAGPTGESGSSPIYAVGFVSGVGVSPGPVRRGSYIKLSATVAPGAGGGAVLDARGRLVGIVFGADTPPPGRRGPIRWESRRPGGKGGATGYRFEYHDPDGPEASGDEEPTIPPEISMHLLEALHRSDAGGGVSYAVPAVLVRHVAEEILRTGSVRRGWVGVKIEETEPGEVRLLSVVPGSPAERAGLRPGDRIVSFGLGASPVEPLTSSALLVDGIAASVPGTPMSLGIRREERSLKVALVLGESPRTPAPRPAPGMFPRVPPLHRPTLGVEVDQVDDAVRHRLGVPEGIGLIVLKVRDDSRAAEAGMKEGDTIVEAMGSPIRTLIDLRAALQRQGGSGMALKVIRDRRELVLDVPPPPEPPAAPAPPVPPAPAPRAKRSSRSGS